MGGENEQGWGQQPHNSISVPDSFHWSAPLSWEWDQHSHSQEVVAGLQGTASTPGTWAEAKVGTAVLRFRKGRPFWGLLNMTPEDEVSRNPQLWRSSGGDCFSLRTLSQANKTGRRDKQQAATCVWHRWTSAVLEILLHVRRQRGGWGPDHSLWLRTDGHGTDLEADLRPCSL